MGINGRRRLLKKSGEMMPLVDAKCTNCGGILSIDCAKDAAICPYCGSAYVVEKAIQNYNISMNNLNADIVNIYAGNTADRMWEKVQTYFKLDEMDNAYTVMDEMMNQFPEDPRPSEKYVCNWLENLSIYKEGKAPSQQIFNRAVKLNNTSILERSRNIFTEYCIDLKSGFTHNALFEWNMINRFATTKSGYGINCADTLILEAQELSAYFKKRIENVLQELGIVYRDAGFMMGNISPGWAEFRDSRNAIYLYINLIWQVGISTNTVSMAEFELEKVNAIIGRWLIIQSNNSSDFLSCNSNLITEKTIDLLMTQVSSYFQKRICPYCGLGKRKAVLFSNPKCSHCGRPWHWT